MNFETTVTHRNIKQLMRNRYAQTYGLRCHKCGTPIKYGQRIVVHGHRTRRHYCKKCAKELGFYPILQPRC